MNTQINKPLRVLGSLAPSRFEFCLRHVVAYSASFCLQISNLTNDATKAISQTELKKIIQY